MGRGRHEIRPDACGVATIRLWGVEMDGIVFAVFKTG